MATPSWKTVADALAFRLQHQLCDEHSTRAAADDSDCPKCRDTAAYLLWVAKSGRDLRQRGLQPGERLVRLEEIPLTPLPELARLASEALAAQGLTTAPNECRALSASSARSAGPCSDNGRFEVVTTVGSGQVASRYRACFTHGMADVDRAYAAGSIARVELLQLDEPNA